MQTIPQENILRTADEYFADLSDFPFQPNYIEVNGLRIHYIDEGARDAQPIVLFHGEPTWSYLYRKMIPILVDAGYRVLAPDLIGFGRSDKLKYEKDHSYQLHIDSMQAWLNQLNLKNIVPFVQDWGGLIGLRLVTANPDNFAAIMIANTGLPGKWPEDNPKAKLSLSKKIRIGLGFGAWRSYSQLVPNWNVGKVINLGTVRKLSSTEIAAYNAPFPDKSYKAGPRVMPRLIMTQLRENTKAWKVLSQFEKPVLTAFSDKDPITSLLADVFKYAIKGAAGQPHTIIRNAGHFLQEDKGKELAQQLISFLAKS